MLLNFTIQNFGSIRDKQTLSFEADNSDHLENAYVMQVGKYRVLKLGLIYGANASGKTTILKALEFLRSLVIDPQTKKSDILHFQPFLFDGKTPRQPAKMSIAFLQKGIRYEYVIEVNRRAILLEELKMFKPKKAILFTRTTNSETQFAEISFGGKLNSDKAIESNLTANTLWNNTVLGGFLKTNIELPGLGEVVSWFRDYFQPVIYPDIKLGAYITSLLDQGDLAKDDLVTLLQKADFNIADIVVRDDESSGPEHIMEMLQRREERSEAGLERVRENGKVSSLDVEFTHVVDNQAYNLPFKWESQGTQRYYGFAGLLAMLLKTPSLLLIDELESSLHPDLYEHFLLLFLLNSTHSQIIATTHYREILNNRDIFRDDAIWFTDKHETGATQLYSLTDFDSSVVRDTTNVLNAYKSGKLSGTPRLSDTYLEVAK